MYVMYHSLYNCFTHLLQSHYKTQNQQDETGSEFGFVCLINCVSYGLRLDSLSYRALFGPIWKLLCFGKTSNVTKITLSFSNTFDRYIFLKII